MNVLSRRTAILTTSPNGIAARRIADSAVALMTGPCRRERGGLISRRSSDAAVVHGRSLSSPQHTASTPKERTS